MAESDDKKTEANVTDTRSKTSRAQTAESSGTDDLSGTDAIALLKNDHRKVEKLFEAFEKATRRADKQSIVQDVCNELVIHAMIEEEIFYPSCRAHVDDSQLDEAQVEHDTAKVLINELLSGKPTDEFFDAKVKVLSELIKHHVREEEQRAEGIFAKAKVAGLDTEDLARRLAERKTELMAEAADQELERPKPRSFTSRTGNPSQKEESMARYDDDDDDRRGSRRSMPERDSQGRFMSDDDRGGRNGRSTRSRDDEDYDDRRSSRSGGSRYRDEEGRFSSSGGGGYRSRSRYEEDDDRDDGRSSRSRYEDDDDDRRGGRSSMRNRSQGGWFGDSEGHSEASRRGWQNSDHGDSGWYGDSEGHSEASRRGWQNPDHGDSGWYGDPEGHSEASRRGWEGRRSSSGGRSYASRDDDDDRRRARSRNGGGSRSSGGSRSQGGRGHGGWFGDTEGHSEASRRGWENR